MRGRGPYRQTGGEEEKSARQEAVPSKTMNKRRGRSFFVRGKVGPLGMRFGGGGDLFSRNIFHVPVNDMEPKLPRVLTQAHHSGKEGRTAGVVAT